MGITVTSSHDTSMSMSASEVATVVDKPDFLIAERCGGAGGAAASGAAEAERDEAAVDTASILGLRFPEARAPGTGAEMDKAGNLGTERAASAETASASGAAWPSCGQGARWARSRC